MKKLLLTNALGVALMLFSSSVALGIAVFDPNISLSSLKKDYQGTDIYGSNFINRIMYSLNIPVFKGSDQDRENVIKNWNNEDPKLLKTTFEIAPGIQGTIADKYAVDIRENELLPSRLVPVGGLYVKGPIFEVLKKLGLQTLSEEKIDEIARLQADKIIAKHKQYEIENRRLTDERRNDLSLKSLKDEYIAHYPIEDIYSSSFIYFIMRSLDLETQGSDERTEKVIKSWNSEDPKLLGTKFELVSGSKIYGTIADEYAANILVKSFLPPDLQSVGGFYVRNAILNVLKKLGLQTLSEEKIKEVAKLKADEIIAINKNITYAH